MVYTRGVVERAGQQIENFALEYLCQGREDWDEPHTRAVVYYAEKLALASGLDVLVFTTAAWLHDIGYFGLFEDGEAGQYAQITDRKKLHMEIGAKMAKDLLNSPGIREFYTPEQIEQIVHLVGTHDKLTELLVPEEFVFVEADTLGAIDLTRVVPTFDKVNGLKYIESLRKRRVPLFVSDLGKEYLAELLPKFEAYFMEME